MAHHGFFFYFSVFFCVVLSAGKRHECDRLCGESDSKKCVYHFTIGISRGGNEKPKNLLSINGRWPGPMIAVCQNDTIVVNVRNQLPLGMETSLHWHGISEGLSPFMDGVAMVTQCPILPHTRFKYQFKAVQSGTFYYHAHSVEQQLDGIHGPLIIRNRKNQLHSEKIVFVSTVQENVQTLNSNFEADLKVTSLRLETFDDFTHDKKDNQPQRLRIINGVALNCPIRLYTHIVPLKIVAVDGNDVVPTAVEEVLVNPGERVDLLVNPEVMKVIHIVGENLCKNHSLYGLFSGSSKKDDLSIVDHNLDPKKLINNLQSKDPEILQQSDLNLFLPFDVYFYKNFTGVVDFRYKLGAKTPYAPSFLVKSSVPVIQVYNKTFLYPPSPVLSQPYDVPEDVICSLEERSDSCVLYDNGFCECTLIVDLPYNKNVDLFVIDEGKNSNVSHAIHIHGHSFHVLSVQSFDRPITERFVREKEALGEIRRNLINTVKKDTIVVPNKGFVVLRLKTNNPGKWLLESITSKARTGFGLELILNMEDPEGAQVPPKGFPTCRSMKEPDMVFGSD